MSTRVAICVITYQRPLLLARLLDGLNQLIVPAETQVRVVVVENESDGPAAAVCREHAGPFAIEFASEPTRGIPFARNTAVAKAGVESDFIAFIDDDEQPEPQWLAELLKVQQATGVDIVAGPVVPSFETEPPEWLLRGRFHERRRLPTGTRVTPMGTGNVLVRREVFERLSPPFDERYALTGGSDSHFFLQAEQAGFTAVWCDEAIVRETVPVSRATAGWIYRRAFRSGANFTLSTWRTQSAPRSLAHISYRAAKHLGWGVLGLPVGALRGRAGLVTQGKHICRGLGILAGLCGWQYDEYRQVHGG